MLWQNPATRKQIWRSLGVLAGLGAGMAGYALFHEPLNVRLDRLTVRLPNAQGRLPKNGLRILHLSDSHFRGRAWRELPKIESIRRACAGLTYDLLIHTGDFLHDDRGLANVCALFDALPAPRLGAFAVFGNHDYMTYSHHQMVQRGWNNFQQEQTRRNRHLRLTPWDWPKQWVRFAFYFFDAPLDLKRTGGNDVNRLETALAERQVQTLHNRHVRLLHNPGAPDGVDVYLAGVDDVVEGAPDVYRALAGIPDDAPAILLSHNPDILEEPWIERADLILSGHTHGGQIVLPLVGAAHTQSMYLDRHRVSGYFRYRQSQIYITRGIGEGIPLRFGAAPQVTLITVLPE
jgi:predicted MPP superfamily phosphohydrolase